MSQWYCKLSKNVEITVGEKLTLSCEGPTEGIAQDSLQIKDAQLTDEVPPLTLLQVQAYMPDKSEFTVTSYRTGDHKSDQVVMYDGKNKVTLTGFDWSLKSVLKQDPTNPPQPVGSFPMWELSYPIWFWILLVVVIVNAIALPYLQFKKIKSRKKAFDDLKSLEAALNPLDTFFKSVRRMEKALEVEHISARGFADQIDKDLKIFLSRSLHIPAHIWGIRQILKEIKKRYPKIYRDHGDDIKKYFSEFAKTKSDIKKSDGLYLMDHAQKLTEIIDEALSHKKKGRI